MDRRGSVIAVVVSALLFGTLAVLTPLAYRAGAKPLPLLAWRFLIASVLLGGTMALRRPSALKVPLSDVGRFAALAVTGYGFASICFFFALLYASASVVAVLLYTYPAMVAIVSWILGLQRPNLKQAVAIAVTFAGVVLVLDPFEPGVTVSTTGLLLGLGAAAGYTSFNLLSARWLPGRSRLVIMAYTFGIASLFVGAVTLLVGQSLSPAAWQPQVWVLLAAIVALPTFGAVVLYLEGIRGLGPSQAAIISTLEPLFTIALAAVVLGERLRPIQWAGAVLVVVGIVFAEIAARRAEMPAPV
jgi:drug/metabolite transporter (DMT)-like permease